MGLHHFGKNPDETGSPTLGGPCHFLPGCNVSEVSEIIPSMPPQAHKQGPRPTGAVRLEEIIGLYLSPFQMGDEDATASTGVETFLEN